MNELQKRLAKLPEDAPLSEVFRVISEWEDWAVEEHRKAEIRGIRKNLSGRIHPICLFQKSLLNIQEAEGLNQYPAPKVINNE